MHYEHRDVHGSVINLPLGKVVCVGRNYAAHAKELGNAIPEIPLLFMKPKTSLCRFEPSILIPKNKGSVHFETEIAVLLQKSLSNAKDEQVLDAIWGYGVALDLTLRDLQNELKEKSQPWEKAKAFDGACPVTAFVNKNEVNFPDIRVESFKNKKKVQHVNPEQMLWSFLSLITYMSECFTLEAGDIILTGTPEGVGKLEEGDGFSVLMKNQDREFLKSSTSIE